MTAFWAKMRENNRILCELRAKSPILLSYRLNHKYLYLRIWQTNLAETTDAFLAETRVDEGSEDQQLIMYLRRRVGARSKGHSRTRKREVEVEVDGSGFESGRHVNVYIFLIF